MMDTEITLSGKTICPIGRFAAMSQKEFRQFAGELGCPSAAVPNRQTDYVIVGDEGCADSSSALLKAWELRKTAALQIISEREFYRLAGHLDAGGPLVSRLTLLDLARTLQVPSARLRQWVRWGLLKPVEVIHRLEFFNFAALSTAKRLWRLTETDFTIAQIRRELGKHQHRLPGESVSEVNWIEQHGRLLIRHRGQLLDGNGQRYFDFSESPETNATFEIPPAPADLGRIFEKALLAEMNGRLTEAAELYQTAIAIAPGNPILYFNLGNTLYAQGRLAEARDAFLKTLNLDDGYAEAWNNLGNAYLEMERWKDAIDAFGRALKLVGHYPEARHNLDLALSLLAERRRTKVYP